jgi:hypothetical protein
MPNYERERVEFVLDLEVHCNKKKVQKEGEKERRKETHVQVDEDVKVFAKWGGEINGTKKYKIKKKDYGRVNARSIIN